MPMRLLVGAVAVAGLATFAWYRWRQRERVSGVKGWVVGYLRDRFGAALSRLSINCSDDPRWPVLVGFDDPRTGLRHPLRFSCAGRPSTYSLLSEEQEKL